MENKPQRKIIIVIVLALLIPVFSYTIFQFIQSDENEKIIQSLYDRQLGSIFTSINQHCWDRWEYWLSDIKSIATNDIDNIFTKELLGRVQEFVDAEPVIAAVFLRYSPQHFISTWAAQYDDLALNRWNMRRRINKLFYQQADNLASKIQYAEAGYTKPIVLPWENERLIKMSVLLFPIVDPVLPNNGVMYAGIIIEDRAYIEEILARRFNSMNENNDFIFAVAESNSNTLVFHSLGNQTDDEFEKAQQNWLFPNLLMQIRMSGTTLETVSQERMQMNLLYLIIVNILFIFGVVYLIRNFTKEMELAGMKTNFVANVSHELRTPIALIRMYSETLEMGRIPNEDRKKKYYRTIMSETARLTQLINNILDFSKIESRKKKYQMTTYPLEELVQQVLEMYKYHLEHKGFSIEKNIEPELPPVKIDHEAITQAFMNLLDNAVKYSGDERKLKVNLYQSEQKLILEVEDFGIGISESDQKKIFDKFFRAGSSLVHNTKGSGLGLSIVRHVMREHKGSVNVKSKLGKGSVFSLVFPIDHSGA